MANDKITTRRARACLAGGLSVLVSLFAGVHRPAAAQPASSEPPHKPRWQSKIQATAPAVQQTTAPPAGAPAPRPRAARRPVPYLCAFHVPFFNKQYVATLDRQIAAMKPQDNHSTAEYADKLSLRAWIFAENREYAQASQYYKSAFDIYGKLPAAWASSALYCADESARVARLSGDVAAQKAWEARGDAIVIPPPLSREEEELVRKQIREQKWQSTK